MTAQRRPGRSVERRTAVLAAVMCAIASTSAAQPPTDDPLLACARAAAQAEQEWRLPQGLLAAIGTVESGRRGAGTLPNIWPWTINAEGRGIYQPSKATAVAAVRALQLRGARLIDVGCFQVDLFYHPDAFATLEQAFDPDANARAAARILSLARLRNTAWDGAIAAYHSSVPLFGAVYLQKVRAIWPSVMARRPLAEPLTSETFAVLLSPQALLVRVVTPASPAQPLSADMPRVIDVAHTGVVQWLQPPPPALPVVLAPSTGRTSSR
jgi:hypothetical protein